MSDHKAVLGSAAWVQQTQGWMTAAERRSLVGPLAWTHLSDAVGRLRMAVRLRDYPRAGFKKAFADAFRAEAVRVPQGRATFVNRYGALITAIKLAPFDE